MKRTLFLLLVVLSLFTGIKAQNALPQVVSGTVVRIENFPSRYITPRNVDIWLPDGYSGSTKYAVLYMHDGQMLFDAAQSWNKQSWDVDDMASELISHKQTAPFIVVGIWNSGQTRHADYFPQKPFERMARKQKDTVVAQLQRAGMKLEAFQPQSDNYLLFIAKELKPYIDGHYPVITGPAGTFMAGSSMGGLISLYALCEYPDIFGGAACLSTHWVGTFTPENNPIPDALLKYLRHHLPDPKTHKIYFDCGDQTLDAMYPAIQGKVDRLMAAKGYGPAHWATKYFPGEDHSEKAWKKRLDIPLLFLLQSGQ